MDIEQLRKDAADGKLHVEPLIEIIASLLEINQQLREEIQQLRDNSNDHHQNNKLGEPYSEKAEKKRKAKRRRRPKPLRRGRVSTADKIKLAERTEQVFPQSVDPADCKLSHTRVAWRLEEGRAVLVAYEVYRCGNQFGKPAGLLGRGEYGIEILIALAYQVYCLGLSIDKACALLSFFQRLSLRKSQADAMLNQLARSWESEFDALCTLLANSAVVHCDETSWSINSVWAFLSEKLTVLFYGVHKDGQTLAQILDKSTFAGVLVSDDAAVYQNFGQAQKCWAHLIRKAIKLTLQAPDNPTYRHFADRLLEIYDQAKRAKADGRLGDAGRLQRVSDLEGELLTLCAKRYADDSTAGDEVENDYRRLCNELTRLVLIEELFVFVTEAEVDGNNNASERQLREDALARKTGRTSKTAAGAKRRSIISSVLQSIGKQLEKFSLESVIEEIKSWSARGQSCFAGQLESSGLSPPQRDPPLLDRIILAADS